MTIPPPLHAKVRIAGHQGVFTFLGMHSGTVAHLWSASGRPAGNRFVPLADLAAVRSAPKQRKPPKNPLQPHQTRNRRSA